MFVYGNIEDKKSSRQLPSPEPQSTPPPKPEEAKSTVSDPRYQVIGEVEYFDSNLQSYFIRILLFCQIPLYIIIFACQVTLLVKFEGELSLVVTGAASGIWGLALCFLEATIFSLLAVIKLRGCLVAIAMGFQIASSVVASFALMGSIAALFTTWKIRYDYHYPNFPLVPIPAYDQTNWTHDSKSWDEVGFAICLLISTTAVLYIITCVFISIFFCGGACCGTPNKVPEFFEVTDSQAAADGDTVLIGTDNDSGFYLNVHLVKMLLKIQVVTTVVLMIYLIIKTAVYGGDRLSFICFLWPVIFFAVGSLFSLISIKSPTGLTVGSAYAFQIISAVIATFIGFRSLTLLSFGKNYKGGLIAIHVLILLDVIAFVVCCVLICIQYTRVSCCGRYKVHQSGYGGVEWRIRVN